MIYGKKIEWNFEENYVFDDDLVYEPYFIKNKALPFHYKKWSVMTYNFDYYQKLCRWNVDGTVAGKVSCDDTCINEEKRMKTK